LTLPRGSATDHRQHAIASLRFSIFCACTDTFSSVHRYTACNYRSRLYVHSQQELSTVCSDKLKSDRYQLNWFFFENGVTMSPKIFVGDVCCLAMSRMNARLRFRVAVRSHCRVIIFFIFCNVSVGFLFKFTFSCTVMCHLFSNV